MKQSQTGSFAGEHSRTRVRLLKNIGSCRIALSLIAEQLTKTGLVAGCHYPLSEASDNKPALWGDAFHSRELVALQIEAEEAEATPFMIRARLDLIEETKENLRLSLSFIKSDAFPVGLAGIAGYKAAAPSDQKQLLPAKRRFPDSC